MYEPEDDLLAGRPAPEQPEEWDDEYDGDLDDEHKEDEE